MNVIGGVMLFVAGLAVGGGAVAYNGHAIRKATTGLHRENERLKTCAWEDKLDYVYKQAYDEGYVKGRKSPMNDVELLADTIERRHIDFRPPKTLRRSEDGKTTKPHPERGCAGRGA